MGNARQRVLIESAEDARSIAERAFTMRHPDHGALFKVVWNVMVRKKNADAGGDLDAVTSELAVADVPDHMTVELVQEIAIYVETMMDKFPLVREEIIRRVHNVCRKYGKPKDFAESTAKHLDRVLQSERFLLVVRGTRSGDVREEPNVVESDARKQEFDEYDIFVWENKVWVRKSLEKNAPHREIRFRQETVRYRVFIMMLRYRGQPLPTRWLYTKAWRREPSEVQNLLDKDFSEELRYVIRDVEKKLGVPYLYTPDKPEAEDYVCMGNFSFWLGIPMSLAEELSMR